MNFGLAIASQRIPGTKIDLLALNNHHEPESANAALITYGKIFMPERDLEPTIKRLTPLLTDPSLIKKVDDAAGKTATPTQTSMVTNNDDMMMNDDVKVKEKVKGLKKGNGGQIQYAAGNNTMLSQVVGIIIGSPEFQRK
jgi:hypothetical protein